MLNPACNRGNQASWPLNFIDKVNICSILYITFIMKGERPSIPVIQFPPIDPAVEAQVAPASLHSTLLQDGLSLPRPPKGASGYVSHIIRSEVAFLFIR